MDTTLTFRRIPRSGAVEGHARELASRLERVAERIGQCHITLQGPAEDERGGDAYLVTIELTVPGARIHADNLRAEGAGRRDIYLAMRAAYDDAKHQLQQLRRGR